MGEADCRIASIGVKQLLESLFKECEMRSTLDGFDPMRLLILDRITQWLILPCTEDYRGKHVH